MYNTQEAIEAEYYRESDFYQQLTPYLACAYAEGFCEGEGATQQEQLIAWQYIADTGLWGSLQGWYGRTVHALIDEGYILRPQ